MSLPSIDAFNAGNFLSACTAALTKKPMKPSLTPCSFSKRSLYLLRSSMIGCMLTSLNVVRIAAVDCDCTSRSATRWRNRDIGTRCSGREPSAGGSETGGAEGLAEGATGCTGGAAGLGAGAAGAALASTAAATSSFVMRLPRPVPVTVVASTPLSAIILRAAGIAGAGSTAGAGCADCFGGDAAGLGDGAEGGGADPCAAAGCVPL